MNEMMDRIQFNVRKTSSSLGIYLFQLMTGGWMGWVLAFVAEETLTFGNFLFIFLIVLTTGVVVKVTRGWGFVSLMILNLVCILICISLKMYIQVAAGS